MKNYKTGDIVTVRSSDDVSLNTFIVDSDCEDSVLLSHPLAPICLIRCRKEEVDIEAPHVKDSTERSLDFATKNKETFDYNTKADLESLCLYFIISRKLTTRQKRALSNMCGTIASNKLNNNIHLAMRLVKDNEAILDDFNAMWYRNFRKLFDGEQPITSNKQRAAIFNIAGFIMAELENPSAANNYNK